MEKYLVYKVTFLKADNALQKSALNALNKHLKGRIIVNTSMPVSALFAEGGNIGTELEIESSVTFSKTELDASILLTNKDLGVDIIDRIEGIGENIIDSNNDNDIYIDLVGIL